jgi:hypothetical protein
MTISKTQLSSEGSPKIVTTNCGGGKTISTVQTYKHGVVTVVEMVFSDASSNFIKFASNGALELGGTLEMGTGTQVKW